MMVENKTDKKIRRAFRILGELVSGAEPQVTLKTLVADKPKTAALVQTLIKLALHRPVHLQASMLPERLIGPEPVVSPRKTLEALTDHLTDLRHNAVSLVAEELSTSIILEEADPKVRQIVSRIMQSDLGAVTAEVARVVWPDMEIDETPGRLGMATTNAALPDDVTEELSTSIILEEADPKVLNLRDVENHLRKVSEVLRIYANRTEIVGMKSRTLEIKLQADYLLTRVQFLGHAERKEVQT